MVFPIIHHHHHHHNSRIVLLSSVISVIIITLLIISSSISSILHQVEAATCLPNTDCTVAYSRISQSTWSLTPCQGETYSGTSGQLAVVRSATLKDRLDSTASNGNYFIGCTDVATEGTWAWPTGEIMSTGSTPLNSYTWTEWRNTGGYNDPNGGTNDNWCVAVAAQNHQIADNTLTVGGAVSYAMCTFDIKKYYSMLVSTTYESSDFNFAGDKALLRYIVVSEHVTWDTANSRCNAMTQSSPWDGSPTVNGMLAQVYNDREKAVVDDIINSKSDVRMHTDDATFGIWIGASGTATAGEGVVDTDGSASATGAQIALFDNNACTAFPKCNLAAGTPASNKAVSYRVPTATRGSYDWKLKTTRLPFVCVFRFDPMAYSTIFNYNKNYIASSSSARSFIVKYFHEWKTWNQAQSACNSLTESNGVGDTANGQLATFFWDAEKDIVQKMLKAAGLPSVGNGGGSNQKKFGGAWIGVKASTAAPYSGTGLAGSLRWNQGGKVPYESSLAWQAKVFADGSTTLCPPAQSGCVALDSTTNTIPYGTNAAVAWDGEDTTFNALAETEKRPYICTFRFPVRPEMLNEYFIIEQHPILLAWDDAAALCATRTVNFNSPTTITVTGQLSILPKNTYSRMSYLVHNDLYSVFGMWVGGKASNGKCLTYHPALKVFRFDKDCTEERPFVCHFIHPNSKTLTMSKSQTVSKSAGTPSITKSVPPTPSKSIPETLTRSVSSTPSSSASSSTSQSSRVSHTESDELTRSKTKSFTKSKTSSKTVTGTKSISTTLTHTTSITKTSTTTVTATLTIPPTPTTSFSLTKNKTASISHEETASVPESSSKSKSLTRIASPSLSEARSPSSTASRTRIHSASVTDGTFSFSHEISESASFLVKAVPAQSVIQTVTDAASIASALSGVPAAAVNQARLNAIKKLFKCGEGEGIGDEPELMDAPLKLSWGSEPFNFARGLLLGNSLFMLGCAVFVLSIAVIYCLVFGTSFRSANLRLRNPGVLFIGFAIFVPPSAEAATILVFYGQGAKDLLIGVGFCVVLVFFPLIVLFEVGRVNSNGRVKFEIMNINKNKSKLNDGSKSNTSSNNNKNSNDNDTNKSNDKNNEQDNNDDDSMSDVSSVSSSDNDYDDDSSSSDDDNNQNDIEQELEEITSNNNNIDEVNNNQQSSADSTSHRASLCQAVKEAKKKRKLEHKRAEKRQERAKSCARKCQKSSAYRAMMWLIGPRFEWTDTVPSLSEQEVKDQKEFEEEKKRLEDLVARQKNKKDSDFFDTLLSGAFEGDDEDGVEINNNNNNNDDEEMINLEALMNASSGDVNLNLLESSSLPSASPAENTNTDNSLTQPLILKNSKNSSMDSFAIPIDNNNDNTSFRVVEKKKKRLRVTSSLKFLEKNPFFAMWGASGFEDFSLAYFAPFDLLASVLIGVSAGIASGVTTFPVCITCFAVSILAAGAHLYTVLRYLCVTPYFVLGYTILGDVLTFTAIVLAFIQFLLKAMNEENVFAILSMINAALGLCAALIGIVSIVNFFYQMFDSWFGVRREEEEMIRKLKLKKDKMASSKSKAAHNHNDDDDGNQHLAFAIPEDMIDELDLEKDLADLDNNNNVVDDEIDIEIEEDEDIDLEEFLIAHEADNEIEVPDQKEEEQPDLNHLLDDGEDDDDEINLDNDYKLDDDDEDADANGMSKGVGRSKNEELERRMRELKKMLDKET